MIIIITSQRDGERESELRYVTDNKCMRQSEGKEITGVWPVVENGRLGDCIVVKGNFKLSTYIFNSRSTIVNNILILYKQTEQYRNIKQAYISATDFSRANSYSLRRSANDRPIDRFIEIQFEFLSRLFS